MKFLLILLIVGMSFLSGCKQCGRSVTFGECDPEIVSDARPVPPAAPTPGLTFSTLSCACTQSAEVAGLYQEQTSQASCGARDYGHCRACLLPLQPRTPKQVCF